LGKLEGGSYTGGFERRMNEGSRNGAFLSEGALCGEPGEMAYFTGDSEGYAK